VRIGHRCHPLRRDLPSLPVYLHCGNEGGAFLVIADVHRRFFSPVNHYVG
jgi:hypothetical protein